MRVQCTLVGIADHSRRLSWPDDWPVPRVGEVVDLVDLGSLYVRDVVWFPEGDADRDGTATTPPFVYLVIGPRRR